ncbi:RimJ/RimL family protein N-acetyltransferase [Novosphingobium kunmingense]|uniref:RimJ/RimL family protein N-acetyltransferase n=1 Tax=Novosphingobium kunmingense TaxID=1211806 RepID=A0A2N0H6V8_9SPHN|nr:GNAT family N-acetyltransferase [Novosphingobium kunmingense]PKB14620.1 RimJ/RimL family protein N-acetyltransferase [Novosphingobium kunmingense]
MARPAEPEIDDTIAHTRLEDGRPVCIRAVRPDDEERLRDGIDRLSQHSRYLRFFSVAPAPPDHVIERLVDVDGHLHLAWGAILSEGPADEAIGVVHAIRSDEAKPRAEFAIGIVDAYHGQGLARMLTAVLLIHCAREGIATLDAQVLAENTRAIGFIRSLGGKRTQTEDGVADFSIAVRPALAAMRASAEPAGLSAVFGAFAAWL